ncbi:MAG: hypothetical protein EXS14_05135 [Planctomycetes bacterium]|nr:hypothetical protein [Planctomycetota bacterium]
MRIIPNTLRIAFAFCAIFVGAVAFTGGPPAGFTGGSTEAACTACHTGAALNAGPAQFTLTASPSFTGGTATISAAFGTTPSIKHGFQFMGKDSSSTYLSGWSLTNNSTTQKNGPNHVNHTGTGTTVTSWSANVTPGAIAAGPVSFYAAGNQTNNNSAPNGDNIYTRNTRVYQAGLSAAATWNIGSVQPLVLAAPTVPYHLYIIAVSELASPSTPLGGVFEVPINLSGQLVSIGWSMPTIFQNFIGALDAQGNATAVVVVPNLIALSGITLHFAYATVAPSNTQVTEVSNGISRMLQ